MAQTLEYPVVLMVRMSRGQKSALATAAVRQGRSVAEIVREALSKVIDPIDWEAELAACEDAASLRDLAKRLIGVVRP